MDYIPLTKPPARKASREKQTDKSNDNLDEHDDFAGVIINAGKSINAREMVIIWLWFLIIHSEIFIERFLAHIPGACDSSNNMTMSGTIYASFIMIVGVILIDMIYR
jgi:hypothetical protein